MAAAIVVAIAVAGTACGGAQRDAPAASTTAAAPADAGPPPVDRDAMRELADGMLEVLQAMAEVMDARAGDCAAIAVDLKLVFDQASTIFDAARAADADPAAHEVLLEEMDRHAAEVAPLLDRIGPGLTACRDHPELIEVMEHMPVL
ncbi:MAG: hypothetical protein H6708_15470 [Kofleriaceae bacterium]|nr:hypothetical protein [Kofleriaceae bacterium]